MGVFSPSGAGASGGGGGPSTTVEIISGSGAPVTTPTTTNLSVPSAATEVSFVFPANTKRFLLSARKTGAVFPVLKIAYVSGQTGTLYRTIYSGAFYAEDGLDIASLTLYVQSNLASTVVEITSWV